MIEVTIEEQILKPIQQRSILHAYEEPLKAIVPVYALEEIVAEKLRAILQHGGLYKSPTNDHFVLQPAPLSHFSVDLIWKTTQLEPLFLRTKCSAIV